jgi:hypothetical protein
MCRHDLPGKNLEQAGFPLAERSISRYFNGRGARLRHPLGAGGGHARRSGWLAFGDKSKAPPPASAIKRLYTPEFNNNNSRT